MSGISDLVAAIAKNAPLLASIIPIPGAGIIGQMIAQAFGGDFNDPGSLASIINKDPNAAIKLLEIQSNMKIQLEQIAATNLQNQLAAEKVRMGNQTAQLEQDRLDRANARDLLRVSNMPIIVSTIILVGFFVIIYLIIFVQLNNKETNVLFLLFGTVASAFASVVSYWLGSSSGSKIKETGIMQQASSALLANQQVENVLAQAHVDNSKIQAETAKVAAETAKVNATIAAHVTNVPLDNGGSSNHR